MKEKLAEVWEIFDKLFVLDLNQATKNKKGLLYKEVDMFTTFVFKHGSQSWIEKNVEDELVSVNRDKKQFINWALNIF